MEREHDPGSTRLTPDQVVEIHLAHKAGESWHSIAERYGTKWKNISRIINGDRWPDLHPSRRPELYTDKTDWHLQQFESTLVAIEDRVRTLRSIMADYVHMRGLRS
jgi:hypothetical protein